MTRLIKAETLHLRSLKSTYVTALAIVALTTLIVVADFSDGVKTSKELLESFMATMTLLPAMALALFAATRTAAEFRYETIAHRAVAAPRRTQLVAAKLFALVPLAALVTAVSMTAGTVAGSLATSGTDPTLHLTAASVAEVLMGTTLFAALGVAVGFLARSQTAAVLIVFGTWVAEKLLEALIQDGSFLPYGMLNALAEQKALAGAGLALLAAAALAAATTLLTRKDVI